VAFFVVSLVRENKARNQRIYRLNPRRLKMKRLAWLFLAVLCSAILLNAEDNTMSGWVCDSKCVVQNNNRATCDPACTARGGDTVFISDEGAVSTVSNPDVCASHMNKHVKATYSRNDQIDQQVEQRDIDKARRDKIAIQELRDEGGLGH
jgi:hypothetical protein